MQKCFVNAYLMWISEWHTKAQVTLEAVKEVFSAADSTAYNSDNIQYNIHHIPHYVPLSKHSYHFLPPSVWPHLFCGAGLEKRRGEKLKWSLAFRLYIGSFVFHVHSNQDQFIQPGWAECVLFSLGLYFVCWYCFNLFVCPHPFVFPWAVESFTGLALA